MGIHTLDTPSQGGLGQKVETFIHGLGMFKTAYDVGHLMYGIGRAAMPYVASALTAAI